MSKSVLIIGTNWVGDAVMTMPAVQLFAEQNPDTQISILVRPALGPLWRVHDAIHEVEILVPGSSGTVRTAWGLQDRGFSAAYVLPNSVRSALIPYLAGIPRRHGAPGHHRAWMLTRIIDEAAGHEREEHQVYRYPRVLGVDCPSGWVPEPHLSIPSEMEADVRTLRGIDADTRWVGLAPGAARGPSKRWPTERFGEVGRLLASRHGVRVMVFGTHAEMDMCCTVADAIGPPAVNLAGRTLLHEAAALLGACEIVVTNDSGLMHLAAAVDTPVVAIFGLTDPTRTGPMGTGHRVITRSGVKGSARIRRHSRAARAVLESILTEEVCAAADALLSGAGPAARDSS